MTESSLVHYQSADQWEHCLHVFSSDQAGDSVPVILLFPAMGVKSPYYFPLAQHFNRQGIHFICTDLRGHGPMHPAASRTNNFGYHELVHQDWPSAVEKVRELYPKNPVFLMGHSLGAQLSACYSACYPNQVDGLIWVAAGNVFYKAYRKKWRVLLGTHLLWLTSAVMGSLPGKQLGFGGKEACHILRDWAFNARTGRYRLKQSDKQQIIDGKMSQVKTPIFAMSFDGDRYSPHCSMQSLLDKFPIAPKHHVKISALELGVEKLGHFNWVKNGDKLVPKIADWAHAIAKHHSAA